MATTLTLMEFLMWVEEQRVKEKVLSRSPDFATRKTADFRIDSLDQTSTMVGNFVYFKYQVSPATVRHNRTALRVAAKVAGTDVRDRSKDEILDWADLVTCQTKDSCKNVVRLHET